MVQQTAVQLILRRQRGARSTWNARLAAVQHQQQTAAAADDD